MNEGRGADRFDQWALDYGKYYPAGTRYDREFRLSRMLVLAARRWTSLIDDTIKQSTGQSRARWQTLFAICFSARPVTTLDLSDQMGVQWPTLVRTLNELEADGLVTRTENPQDRRSRMIAISDEGRRLIGEVQPILDPMRHLVLERFTDEEVAEAERLLGKLLTGAAEAAARG